MLGKKMIERGWKKEGNYKFFPQLLQSSYAYFPPNWLKIYKIATKKGWKYLACGAHTLIIINSIWGKNIKQEGVGGQKYEFQIYYTPLRDFSTDLSWKRRWIEEEQEKPQIIIISIKYKYQTTILNDKVKVKMELI